MTNENLIDDNRIRSLRAVRRRRNYNFDFDRRDFIKAFGLGIVFIVPAARALAQQRGQGESGRGGNERLPNDIDAWIHINEDGERNRLHRQS